MVADGFSAQVMTRFEQWFKSAVQHVYSAGIHSTLLTRHVQHLTRRCGYSLKHQSRSSTSYLGMQAAAEFVFVPGL